MSRSFRTSAVAGILLLALAGCAGDGQEASEKSPVTTVTTQTTTTTTAPAPAAQFTLLDLQSGDAACYLQVTNADGAESFLPGAFELCPGESADATPYVGKRVHLERRPDRIIADSCQGDPACHETQPVDLVVAVKPAR